MKEGAFERYGVTAAGATATKDSLCPKVADHLDYSCEKLRGFVMALPLEGITVIEVCQSVAGPYATMLLADLGARVIKVEPPDRGDDSRNWYPPAWGPHSTAFLAFNRNKESIVLDLKTSRGREALLSLVRHADVFVQNYRFGALAKLGFDYPQLAQINPRLVYCNITAFGTEGPLRELPGYDPLMQAFGGIMSVTGEEGRPPVRVGVSIIDMGTGLWCALGAVAALYERQFSGRGKRVDVSLFETALGWVNLPLLNYLATGQVPRRAGSGLDGIVPYQAFPTADGYIVIAAGNDALWRRLCAALGVPDLADDPRFQTNPSRVQNREALERIISELLSHRGSAEWEQIIRAAGVPCSALQNIAQVAAHPQTTALQMIQEIAEPHIPGLRNVGLPIRFDGIRPRVRRAAPALGADTERILTDLGMRPTDIREKGDGRAM